MRGGAQPASPLTFHLGLLYDKTTSSVSKDRFRLNNSIYDHRLQKRLVDLIYLRGMSLINLCLFR
jgi:hypothetical protein